ncbi:MAG: HD domain-containing protein [Akkermansiaceae bacterium]
MNGQDTIDEIMLIFRNNGQESYGEDITQLEHAVQVGLLAINAGCDDETVVAAFLHDIGHLCAEDDMNGYGARAHHESGALWLRERGFSERVCRLIEGHVLAKRYLTAVDEEYHQQLSEASKASLGFQGGPMNEEEVKAFANDSLLEEHLQLRRWDEEGKDNSLDLTNLEQFRPFLERHLSA